MHFENNAHLGPCKSRFAGVGLIGTPSQFVILSEAEGGVEESMGWLTGTRVLYRPTADDKKSGRSRRLAIVIAIGIAIERQDWNGVHR